MFENENICRFYLTNDTFDGVPISMANRLKLEPCSTKRRGQMLSVIDEKHGVGNVVFLTEFPQKLLC